MRSAECRACGWMGNRTYRPQRRAEGRRGAARRGQSLLTDGLVMTSQIFRGQGKKFHVDIEELIREVHYRPALWNKCCIGYTDRKLKARMWDEVCESIIGNWKQLKILQQNTISREIQKKWRNVKDAFNKEMKRKTTGTDNIKKQYCHFKALSFLCNSEVYTSRRAVSVDDSDEESDNTSLNQENTTKSSRKRTRNKNDDEDDSTIPVKREKFPSDEETNNDEHNTRKSDKHEENLLEIEVERSNFENAEFSYDSTQNREEYTDSHFVEINCDDWDNDIPSEMIPKKDADKNSRDVKVYDEDVSFTEMMIPMLRRLNDDQKHFAKVEILNILHKAKNHHQSTSCQTQTEQDRTACDDGATSED